MIINGEWHSKHRMPKNPTNEQRIEWHLAHGKVCKCCPMPRKLLYLIKKKEKDAARKSLKAAQSS